MVPRESFKSVPNTKASTKTIKFKQISFHQFSVTAVRKLGNSCTTTPLKANLHNKEWGVKNNDR